MAATLAAFPDKGVASVEEARVRMGWLPQLTFLLAVGCKRLGTLQPQLLVERLCRVHGRRHVAGLSALLLVADPAPFSAPRKCF